MRQVAIEVDECVSVSFRFVAALSLQALTDLREAHPKLRELRMSEFLKLAKNGGEIRIDDLVRSDANTLVEIGTEAGLVCRIV